MLKFQNWQKIELKNLHRISPSKFSLRIIQFFSFRQKLFGGKFELAQSFRFTRFWENEIQREKCFWDPVLGVIKLFWGENLAGEVCAKKFQVLIKRSNLVSRFSPSSPGFDSWSSQQFSEECFWQIIFEEINSWCCRD